MKFNFGEVFSRALQITWRHKILWLGGIVYMLFSFITSFAPNYFMNPFFTGNLEAITRIEQEPWYLFLTFGSFFLLILVSIPIGVVALTLPVTGTVHLERGADALKLSDLLRDSLRYFWRVLGAFFLVGVGIFVVVLIFFGCMMLASVATMGIGMVLVFPLYCILMILMLIVYAYAVQAQVSIVADNLGVFDALQRAWEVVKNNFWIIVLLCLVIYFGLWLLSIFVSIPFMIPMYWNMFNMMDSARNFEYFQRDFMKTMGVWVLIYAPIYSVFQGIAFSFMQSAWTLTYLRMTRTQNDEQSAVLPAG